MPRSKARQPAELVRHCISGGLLLGWALGALGLWGPWLGGGTAALSLSGPDLGEFVKFLPAAQSGTLHLHRFSFYSPAFALAVGIALLAQAPFMRLRTWMRIALPTLGILGSLQLLPPAWSPASLQASEFRTQMLAVAISWLLLMTTAGLGRLPAWLTAPVAALISLLSGCAAIAEMRLVRPAVSALYGSAPELGWGLWAAELGILLVSTAGLTTAVLSLAKRHDP